MTYNFEGISFKTADEYIKWRHERFYKPIWGKNDKLAGFCSSSGGVYHHSEDDEDLTNAAIDQWGEPQYYCGDYEDSGSLTKEKWRILWREVRSTEIEDGWTIFNLFQNEGIIRGYYLTYVSDYQQKFHPRPIGYLP